MAKMDGTNLNQGKSAKDIKALEAAIKKGLGKATAKAEAFKGKPGVSGKKDKK
jgi:hypothetical protein